MTAFGLNVSRTNDGIELRAAGSDHRWARLLPSDAKSLAYLSFNCQEADFPAIVAQLAACGAVRAEGDVHASKDGFWFHDPDGNLLQVRVGLKTSPSGKTATTEVITQPGERGVRGRAYRPRTRPTRLSHVLMFTPDLDRALRFYEEGLGLRLSDRSRDIVAFMHAPHGCDHHLVAFVRDAAKGWHHSAWDVPGIEQIGCGAEQMREAGFQ